MEKRSTLIQQKYIERFENELQKIANGLTKRGGIKKYDKIQQKIGRIKEKYSKISAQYSIEVSGDEKKEKVMGLIWAHQPEKQSKAPGIYCIRTNQTQLNNKEIWDTYRMLNDIEEAFRILKTDLGLRPIYHQTTDRATTIYAQHFVHTESLVCNNSFKIVQIQMQ